MLYFSYYTTYGDDYNHLYKESCKTEDEANAVNETASSMYPISEVHEVVTDTSTNQCTDNIVSDVF